jgi:FkbM family methyltransferase
VKTVPVRYFGQTVNLPDLPEYQKFYRKLEAGAWEPHTFRILMKYLDRDVVYIDVGGWIGVTPLWAASLAKRVVIIEPDPACRAILGDLCGAYPNITLLDGALSSQRTLTLHAVDGFGSSETTALDLGSGESMDVTGISVDEIMRHAGNEQIFVKIDIEGYEYGSAGEMARFADYRLRGLQCALHPSLYERCLAGSRPARRMQTLLATAGLARLHRGLSAVPLGTRYSSMFSYLVFGVLFRTVPKGTDVLFTPRAGQMTS